ncbi:MAG: hypothetical protein ACOYYS_26085 [Chloroflexota bacterium]
MKRYRNKIGTLLLALWLILSGFVSLVPALAAIGQVLPIVAIAAGILILMER